MQKEYYYIDSVTQAITIGTMQISIPAFANVKLVNNLAPYLSEQL